MRRGISEVFRGNPEGFLKENFGYTAVVRCAVAKRRQSAQLREPRRIVQDDGAKRRHFAQLLNIRIICVYCLFSI